MGRCEATTKKGTRCRNAAMEGSSYCGVHADSARAGSDPGTAYGEHHRRDGDAWCRACDDFFHDLGEGTRALLGLAAVGLVVLVGLKLGRRL